MPDIHYGWEIDRVANIVLFGFLLIVHIIQLGAEWTFPAKRPGFRWVVHRFGPFSVLFGVLRSIDGWGAFGIFTPANRVAYWFGWLTTVPIFLMAFSMCWAIISTNSGFARVPVPSSTLYGISFAALGTTLVAPVLMIQSYASDRPPQAFIWTFTAGIASFIVLVCFTWSALALRNVLKTNLDDNPQATVRTAKVLRRMTIALIWAVVLLGVASTSLVIVAIAAWNTEDLRASDDPQNPPGSEPVQEALAFGAHVLFLFIAWTPFRPACKADARTVRWLPFSYYLPANSEHDSKHKTHAAVGTAGGAGGSVMGAGGGASSKTGGVPLVKHSTQVSVDDHPAARADATSDPVSTVSSVSAPPTHQQPATEHHAFVTVSAPMTSIEEDLPTLRVIVGAQAPTVASTSESNAQPSVASEIPIVHP